MSGRFRVVPAVAGDPEGGRLPLPVLLHHLQPAANLPLDVDGVHDLGQEVKQPVGVVLLLVVAQLVQPDEQDRQGPAEFDVSRLLQMGNDLEVLVESLSEDGGLWGEVAMEIRATAFLRGVRARREGAALHVEGELVGHSEGPLDLYVLLDDRNVSYTTVQTGEGPQPFHVIAEGLSAEQTAGAWPEVAAVWRDCCN